MVFFLMENLIDDDYYLYFCQKVIIKDRIDTQ